MDRLEEIYDAAPCTHWSTLKRCSNQANTVALNYCQLDTCLLKTQGEWHIHVPTWSLLLHSEIKQGNKPPPLPFLDIPLGCPNPGSWPNRTVRCCYLGYLISTDMFLSDPGIDEQLLKNFSIIY